MSPTLHAAALRLLLKMVRRGSNNVAAVAGACGVAVRTGSRHCCVEFRQQRSGCNAESETSPSLPSDGTLRHLNAAAAPRPRLCRCCLHGLSEVQEITLHSAVPRIFHSLLHHVFKSVHILFLTSLYLIILPCNVYVFPQFSPMWFNKIVKNTEVGMLF